MSEEAGEAASTLLISSAPLEWAFVVERRFYPKPVRVWEAHGFPAHRIMIWDEPVACRIEVGPMGYALDGRPSSMVVVPADTPLMAEPQTTVRYTKLVLPVPLVERTAAELFDKDSARLRPFAGAIDEEIGPIATLLVDVVTGHQVLDEAMLAVLLRAAVVRVICEFSLERPPTTPDIGKLPTRSLTRVLQLIGHRLSDDLSVTDLAREAGFSRAHFSRAFAESVGLPPHAYLLGRRVAKAEQMLRGTALTLDQIAPACGFHDQAHFTRVFRAQRGKTPKRFRDAVRDVS